MVILIADWDWVLIMSNEQPDYFSYLLRLWREKRQRRMVWRASLQGSLTGKRQNFASLEELFVFLRRQTGAECDEDGDVGGSEHQRPPATLE